MLSHPFELPDVYLRMTVQKKTFATAVTFVRSHFTMNSPMNSKLSLSSQITATYITFIRVLSHMNSVMNCKSWLSSISMATHITFIWFFSSMKDLMKWMALFANKGLSSIQGQRWPGGATPCPRNSGCAGAGGPRGAIPRSRSGGAAVRRYPSSKVGATAVLCWSSHEEISHVQSKRNPSKTVGFATGHQRADTLKPYSQKLVNLITLGPQPSLTQWN